METVIMERLQLESFEAFLRWLKRRKNIELRVEVHTSEGVHWLPQFFEVEDLLNEFQQHQQTLSSIKVIT